MVRNLCETGLMWRIVLVASSALSVVACSTGGPCDPSKSACEIEQAVSTYTAAAGEENEDNCQSWTLNNRDELWVSAVRQDNDGAYHHANWFFVPDDLFPMPDGTWSCSAQQFSELSAALAGGFLFAMSTQSQGEEQRLPTGAAVRIPPYSRIIGSSHILNASPRPVTTTMRLHLWTIPKSQVTAKMVPSRLSYHDLAIQPNGKSSFTSECRLDREYERIFGDPLDYQIYYALSHYHTLGSYAKIALAGGPRDGEVIFSVDGYGENFGHSFAQPIDLRAAGATGLRFTCGFDNPRAKVVGWGIGDQEMCVIQIFAKTNLGVDGDVKAGTGTRTGTGPDGEAQFGGPCSLFSIAWDHEKIGGPPR